MQSRTLQAVFCAGAVALLVSCSSDDAMGPPGSPRACDNSIMPGVEVTGGPAAEVNLRTFVSGELASDLLQNETKLVEVMAALGSESYSLRANNAAVRGGEIGEGLAGIPARLFLDAADFAAGPSGSTFAAVASETKGQIEAYYFNESEKSGCLRVLMTSTTTKLSGAQRTEALRWTVFVDPVAGKGLQYNGRVSPPNSKDVFGTGPGTDADTVAINAETAKDFETKLWAKGAPISVESVEKSVNGSSFVLLPKSHPLYKTNPASCIDMMFEGTPPMVLPPGAEPPFYCLGRCASPYIINTK